MATSWKCLCTRTHSTQDCPAEDAENVVKNGTDEDKTRLLRYHDDYISAWNPASQSREQLADLLLNDPQSGALANPSIVDPQTAVHPCHVRSSELENVPLDAAALQRHWACHANMHTKE